MTPLGGYCDVRVLIEIGEVLDYLPLGQRQRRFEGLGVHPLYGDLRVVRSSIRQSFYNFVFAKLAN